MMRFFNLKRKKKKECAMSSTSSSTSLNSPPLENGGNNKNHKNKYIAPGTPKRAADPDGVSTGSIYSSPDINMLDQVPIFIQTLQNEISSVSTIADSSDLTVARVLRKLFAFSEQTETRIPMVMGTKLVPVLLEFCQKCRNQQQHQPQLYLALLVLNNVSIPVPNKRRIALEYRAAAILSMLLCHNPSCHLIAIVLVNLTYADASLRRDLVSTANIQIVEALSYAYRISIMGESEFETRQHLLQFGDEIPPKERLSVLLDFDESHAFLIFTPSKQILYPDTARWSLCALQNLTRPTKDNINPTAHVFLQLGMLPYILRVLTIDQEDHNDVEASFSSLESFNSESPPITSTWDSQSVEDTALFVLLNLTVLPWAHDRLSSDVGPVLARITRVNHESTKTDGDKIAMHQCIKARMALAYLLGSEGNFGQPNQRRYRKKPTFSELVVGPREAATFVEMLANLLHRRSVNGPGGYSIATFSVKNVLFALRCLLTQIENQMRFAETNMECLNSLLLKCLGLYAFQKVSFLDSQSAEHACFSLYLLSNYGFHTCFLPASIGRGYSARSLVAKVLTTLIEMEHVTPATGKCLYRIPHPDVCMHAWMPKLCKIYLTAHPLIIVWIKCTEQTKFYCEQSISSLKIRTRSLKAAL
jgi:hypothetical protein